LLVWLFDLSCVVYFAWLIRFSVCFGVVLVFDLMFVGWLEFVILVFGNLLIGLVLYSFWFDLVGVCFLLGCLFDSVWCLLFD